MVGRFGILNRLREIALVIYNLVLRDPTAWGLLARQAGKVTLARIVDQRHANVLFVRGSRVRCRDLLGGGS